MKTYILIEVNCGDDNPVAHIKGYRTELDAEKAAIQLLKSKYGDPVFDTLDEMREAGASCGIVKDLLAHCIQGGVMYDFKLVLDWVYAPSPARKKSNKRRQQNDKSEDQRQTG